MKKRLSLKEKIKRMMKKPTPAEKCDIDKILKKVNEANRHGIPIDSEFR